MLDQPDVSDRTAARAVRKEQRLAHRLSVVVLAVLVAFTVVCAWVTRDVVRDQEHRSWSLCRARAAPRDLTDEAQAVDVVLMDIRRPGRDGVAVLQEMRPPPPPVIMMTTYAIEERLGKPFAVGHLLQLVAGAASTAR